MPPETAIPTGDGVPKEEEAAAVTTPEELEAPKEPVLTPQQEYREALATKYDEEQPGPPAEAEEEEPAAPPVADPAGDEPPQDKPIIVKIDGVETEVTQEELVSSYQIDRAGRKRLQEAAELKKQVEAELLAAQESQGKSKTGEGAAATQDTDFDIESYIRDIREGGDEDAVEATKKFISSVVKAASTAGKPPADVDSLVEQKLKERDDQAAADRAAAEEAELVTAQEHFDTTYKTELETNEDFFQVAILEDKKLMSAKEWEGKPVQERYLEAGKRAKAFLAKLETGNNSRENRLRSKEKLPNPPSTTRRGGLEKEENQQTPAEIVAEIAASRGQRL